MSTISFARGVPAPECLPVEELADCARVALERDGRTILSYGSSSGYAPLREWIADRHGVAPERVFLTNGSLQVWTNHAVPPNDGGISLGQAALAVFGQFDTIQQPGEHAIESSYA